MYKFFTYALRIGVLLFILALAVVVYIFYYYSKDLPDYAQLKQYHPPAVTRIYSSDGKLMEEYANQYRIFIPLKAIPKVAIEAFVAAEDKNFYTHHGIDIISIIRAAFSNVSNLAKNKRFEGGSTITQQVVKNFLLNSERSLARKVKEAILSYMISKTFSKDRILELYLNEIYLGSGAYGIASASLKYFNKSASELTLAEAALLAGLPKAPSKFSPRKNYEKAMARRNYVLTRMSEDGYISAAVAKETMAEPIVTRKQDKVQSIAAEHYAEHVRNEVINMFGKEFFYTAGLSIITCLDSKTQADAANAFRDGLRNYDKKYGYRGPLAKISLLNWQDELREFKNPLDLLEYNIAVILQVENNQAKIGFSDGTTGRINIASMKWAKHGLKKVGEVVNVGDVVVVSEKKSDKIEYLLQQIPRVNGAMMVMRPYTGAVLASVGGYSFNASKFDRTTQALRQPGSSMKPFIYLSALENGIKPNDIFEDSPIEVKLGYGQAPWRPKNFEKNFLGPMTMRKALEKSRNIVTIRIAQKVGIKNIASTIKKFGINDNPRLVPSMYLGALETTLDRMVRAYGAVASGGKKLTAHYIELIKDRNGKVIYRRDYSECPECLTYEYDEYGNIIPPEILLPEGVELVEEAINYQFTSLLEGVVQRGTGQKAKNLKKVMAGKTGTTNDCLDAWYIGFTPRMIVGTYIGFDNPRSLGRRESGATVALPIFVDFMEKNYMETPSIPFKVPSSVRFEQIDYNTGKKSNDSGAIREVFVIKNFDHFIDVMPDKTSHDPFKNLDNNLEKNIDKDIDSNLDNNLDNNLVIPNEIY